MINLLSFLRASSNKRSFCKHKKHQSQQHERSMPHSTIIGASKIGKFANNCSPNFGTPKINVGCPNMDYKCWTTEIIFAQKFAYSHKFYPSNFTRYTVIINITLSGYMLCTLCTCSGHGDQSSVVNQFQWDCNLWKADCVMFAVNDFAIAVMKYCMLATLLLVLPIHVVQQLGSCWWCPSHYWDIMSSRQSYTVATEW